VGPVGGRCSETWTSHAILTSLFPLSQEPWIPQTFCPRRRRHFSLGSMDPLPQTELYGNVWRSSGARGANARLSYKVCTRR
jgi:hypothetical protein